VLEINLSSMAAKRDSKRAFSQTQKNQILKQQNGKCAGKWCKHGKLDPTATHFHHIKGWADGGETKVKNGAAVCPNCHVKIAHEERLAKQEKGKGTKTGKKTSPKKKRQARGDSILSGMREIDRSINQTMKGLNFKF
jgi:hypothetical protein